MHLFAATIWVCLCLVDPLKMETLLYFPLNTNQEGSLKILFNLRQVGCR